MYFRSIPVHDKSFVCSHQSLMMSLIQLNIILLDLFSTSKTFSAFRNYYLLLGFYLMSLSIQFIFDLKYLFKFLVSNLFSSFLSFFSRFHVLLGCSWRGYEEKDKSQSSYSIFKSSVTTAGSYIEKALFLLRENDPPREAPRIFRDQPFSTLSYPQVTFSQVEDIFSVGVGGPFLSMGMGEKIFGLKFMQIVFSFQQLNKQHVSNDLKCMQKKQIIKYSSKAIYEILHFSVAEQPQFL